MGHLANQTIFWAIKHCVNTFKRTKVTKSIFSDHSGTRLQKLIIKKYGKSHVFENQLINFKYNSQIKEEIKISRHFEGNEIEITTFKISNFVGYSKVVFSGKFLTINASPTKEDRLKVKVSTFMGQKKNSKLNVMEGEKKKKEIMKVVRAETTEIEI